MKIIVVASQAELDALPGAFEEYTRIEIRAVGRVLVNRARGNSSVVARGNSSVVAWGNSSVEARGNSSVVARGNSSVVARGNSSVEARDNSSVVARGNSSVVAWGNSSVEARDNSSVEAWGNSSVVARGNSSVVARGNSSVVARDNVFVRGLSTYSKIEMFGASAVMVQAPALIPVLRSDNAKVLHQPKPEWTVPGWLEREGVVETDGQAILYKRVSAEMLTQEQTPNETRWTVGSALEHPAWNPSTGECGEGKFHACSRPYFCDEFRSAVGDKYVAIRVAMTDLHAWAEPDYPHKIAFRAGFVLYECDRRGREVKS